MSDGKEVKRFYFVPTGEKDVFGSPTFVCHDKSLNGDDWFMPVEDHDRIMAERDELWKRATKFVMPGEMDTGESIEHYIKTLEQTTDRQARVIEKLKGMVSHYETCATVDRYDDEEVPCDCGLEKELEAIEQGEGT